MKKPTAIAMAKSITSILALPEEIVLDLPLITLIGGGELSLENHKGIIEYTETRLRVNTAAGVFRLEGKRLVIKQLTAERILVRGAIDTIGFMR